MIIPILQRDTLNLREALLGLGSQELFRGVILRSVELGMGCC